MAAPPEPTLSTTLQGIASELPEPCTAGEIVQRVLARHGDYARGRAQAIGATVFTPPASRRQPVHLWYDDARALLTADLGKLSGKTVILGLTAADRATGREIVRCGLFHCLVGDVTEGLDLFGERGRQRLATIPRAVLGQADEPVVLHENGRPGARGALSVDGTRAVGYGDDLDETSVALWSVESGVPIDTLRPPPAAEVRMVRFTANGSAIVAMLRDGSIIRWRLDDPHRHSVLFPPVERFASGALSADAACAVIRLGGQGFMVIDLAIPRGIEVATDERLSRISVSPDGAWIAVASGTTGVLYQRDGLNVQAVATFAANADISALECGGGIAVLAAGGQLSVYGPRLDVLQQHNVDQTNAVQQQSTASIDVGRVQRVTISADGSLVAAVSDIGVTMLQPESQVAIAALPLAGAVRAAFSLDGRRMLVNDRDGTMRVWNVGLEPASSRPPAAVFDSDAADDARDFLRRRRDVDAFASLIAAKTVEPPLSIGVFGDWGSGKSWFMDQLKRRVAQIAADTRTAGARQADVSFYKHIAQVHFNVWHYAESDVLTSLVDHVFNRLVLGEVTDTFAAITIEASKALARAGLEERRTAANLDADQAELSRREQERVAEEVRRQSAAVAARSRIETDDEMEELRINAADALNKVGWGGVVSAAGGFVAALRGERAALERASVFLAPLVRGESDEQVKNRRRVVVLTCIVPLAVLVLGGAISLVADTSVAMLASIGAFFASVLAGATRILTVHTTWVRERLDKLVVAEQQIEDKVNGELKNIDASLALARRKEEAQRRRVQARERLHSKKMDAVKRAEVQLAINRPEKVLETLVGGRVKSGEYSRRLGVVSLARGDFEKVSDLIRSVNKSLSTDKAKLSDERDVSVNRIVLYIDDLDRCEPAKVAKVLQAVHLLLAFPLFVVVVGVDPRWVGRALKREFPELLDGEGVEPNDYLEKIFQIPFWLDRLDQTRTEAMLRGLATPPPTAAHAAGAASGPVTEEADSTDDGGGDSNGGGGDNNGEGGDSDGGGATSVGAESTATVNSQVGRSHELNPPGLALQDYEVEAMSKLSSLLGRSPRALKRFVNVYRLFKVRAPDVIDFADPQRRDPDYLIVLYLLSEIIGRPDNADDLFESIRSARDSDTGVMSDVPEGWPRTAGAYKPWLDEVARFSFRSMLSCTDP